MMMMRLAFPLLTLTVALPGLVGLAIRWIRSEKVVRRLGIGAAALTLLMATLASSRVLRLSDGLLVGPLDLAWLGVARPLFGLDGLGAVLLPFFALLTLLVLVAGPRAKLDAPATSAILFLESTVLGMVETLDLGVLGLLFGLQVLVMLAELRRREGTGRQQSLVPACGLYLGASVLLLFIGVAWIGRIGAHAGLAAPLHLPELARHGLPAGEARWALILILCAVLLREGIFPVHSWLPALIERGPLGLGLLFTAAQTGTCVLMRVVLPVFDRHEQGPGALMVVAYLGLLTAGYAALVGLVQRDLRRVLAFLSLGQSALILAGLDSHSVEETVGGLVTWLASGLALTGLGLCTWAVEARVGRPDLRHFHGLAERTPVLAAFYLVLGLAVVGLPGTLDFVSEDLIVEGVLPSHPILGVVLIVAAALNAIVVLRSFNYAFLGPPSARRTTRDLLVRERLALAVLALTLVGTGLLPRTVLVSRMLSVQSPPAQGPVH
jgi:NADH:ubiquinone oxidoreductase subunit 4 (subunit M)